MSDASVDPITPGRYRHHNGNVCEVIGVAAHTETKEDFVIYHMIEPDGGGQFWACPLTEFLEPISVPRHQRIEE